MIGTLGGEIDIELGFGTLEAAQDSIMSRNLVWNQEELEMLREEAKKAKISASPASQTSNNLKQKR